MFPGSDFGGGPEWRFRLFGVPIRVQLWFWIILLILGGTDDAKEMLIWVPVCFVSILIHEFGHVIAFRLFGVDSEIVLRAWGGLAIPRYGIHGTLARFIVSMAGPLAGFGVVALTLTGAALFGVQVRFGWHLFLPTLSAWPELGGRGPDVLRSYYWYVFLNQLLFVNFYWGLVNLLPIYPLDGGQAARAVFERYDPYSGTRKSLILSAVAAAAVAVLGIAGKNLYLVVLFALLAALSLQALESVRHRVNPERRPYRG